MPIKKTTAFAAVGVGLSFSCLVIWSVLHRHPGSEACTGTQAAPAEQAMPAGGAAEINPSAARPGTDAVSADVLRLSASDGSLVAAAERRDSLRRLSCRLSVGEIAAVTNFLRSSGQDTPGVPLSERLALKNDALDLLQRQERPVSGLGPLLVTMMNDPRQPEAWRDYCLQGLAGQYVRAAELDGAGGVEAERALVTNAYATVFSRPDLAVFRGTALRGIANVERECPGIAKAADLDGSIRSIISDASSDEASLITALRMCSERNVSVSLTQVSNIAERGSTPLLRKVAMKTLAEFASADGTRTP